MVAVNPVCLMRYANNIDNNNNNNNNKDLSYKMPAMTKEEETVCLFVFDLFSFTMEIHNNNDKVCSWLRNKKGRHQ